MEQFIIALVQILRVLSAKANKQIEYLKSLGDASVDELGLEFEEVWLQADAALDSKNISRFQYDAIKRLNEVLDQISGEEHESLWTESALIEKNEWEQVRRSAKECLTLFSSN